jgi:hypothetical protein
MYNKESEAKVAIVTDSSFNIRYENFFIAFKKWIFILMRLLENLDKSNILIAVASKENMPIKVLQLDVADDNW